MVNLVWTKERVDKFHQRLLLDVYHEFMYNQRDQAMWDAGSEVFVKIGEAVKLNQGGR